MAFFSGLKSFCFFGLTIYGYFLHKHILYSQSIKRFDQQQAELMRTEDDIKDFYAKKLMIGDQNIENEALYKKIVKKRDELVAKYALLDEILVPADFVIENE